MLRRAIPTLMAAFLVLAVFAPPAAADTQVDARCVTRGPVAGDRVTVCARLYQRIVSGRTAYYAYGGMQSTDGNVRMRIVALHLRQNNVTQAQANTVLSAIGDRHISTTTPVRIPTVCRQNWTSVIGYRIRWTNGSYTPSPTGQVPLPTDGYTDPC
jgi:hypothetical protein